MKNHQKVYTLLTRSSLSKSDERVSKNYILFLLNNFLTQIADALSNTKTILVWLMNTLGAPLYMTALLVPIRESGSMLPQALLANYLAHKKKRRPTWIVGGMIQAVSLVAIGLSALYFQGSTIGWIIIIMIAVFSFGRSLCSLSSKDIMGRTIPKNQRGSLTGYAQSLSGAVILCIGLWFQLGNINTHILPWVIIVAGLVWVLAIIAFFGVYEPKVSNTVSKQSVSIWKTLSQDALLRRFILARSLLLCSALSAPFYVTLAQGSDVTNIGILGVIVVVTGVASMLSSPIWGHMADGSSRKVMSYSGFLGALLALGVTIVLYLGIFKSSVVFYSFVIFLVSIAHNGVRVGRKTYIVNIAEGNRRIAYVSASNTVIAIVLLLVGGMTSLLSTISITWAIGILGVMGFVGSYLSHRLPDACESQVA